MAAQVYLAVDLGAESGRIMAGLWSGKRLVFEEVHRFPNGPVTIAGSLRWDVLRLWGEIQNGLGLAARRYGKSIVSVGADAWGVDYVLLDRQGEMLGHPFHYRDVRTEGMPERAFRQVPRAEIFAQTGLQFLPFNTLFQLLAAARRDPALLERADCLLFIPDFIHWALCGSRVSEFTIASTSQCLHPATRNWAAGLLKKFRLPLRPFLPIAPPGAALGRLRPDVVQATGLPGIRVVAPPSHDTAAAVAGAPAKSRGQANWAYLSSGTWSLLGVEIAQACLTPRALELNLTNEGGLDGTYRLLKNIMGLWLAQGCKRAFAARGRRLEYAELAALAAAARPLRSLINPDDPRFLNPPDMPRAIQAYCRETRQPIPRTEGELVRCAYESLALQYRRVLGFLEEVTATPIAVIHLLGGGSQNTLLNQFTADCCRRPVLAGPVEATAAGNLLVQARSNGELDSLAEMRAALRASIELREFSPGSADPWEAAYARFLALP